MSRRREGGRVAVGCRDRGMGFDQGSAASGKISASIPNDFKRLSKKLIEVTNVQCHPSIRLRR